MSKFKISSFVYFAIIKSTAPTTTIGATMGSISMALIANGISGVNPDVSLVIVVTTTGGKFGNVVVDKGAGGLTGGGVSDGTDVDGRLNVVTGAGVLNFTTGGTGINGIVPRGMPPVVTGAGVLNFTTGGMGINGIVPRGMPPVFASSAFCLFTRYASSAARFCNAAAIDWALAALFAASTVRFCNAAAYAWSLAARFAASTTRFFAAASFACALFNLTAALCCCIAADRVDELFFKSRNVAAFLTKLDNFDMRDSIHTATYFYTGAVLIVLVLNMRYSIIDAVTVGIVVGVIRITNGLLNIFA